MPQSSTSKSRRVWWMSEMSSFCNLKGSKGLESLSDITGIFWREAFHRKLSWWGNFLLCSKLRLSWNLVEVTAVGYKSVSSNETQGAAIRCFNGATVETCIFVLPYMGTIYILPVRGQANLFLTLIWSACTACDLPVTRFLAITELSSVETV